MRERDDRLDAKLIGTAISLAIRDGALDRATLEKAINEEDLAALVELAIVAVTHATNSLEPQRAAVFSWLKMLARGDS